MSDDHLAEGPDVLCARLNALGAKKPTADARRTVVAALDNKWNGVRITAAKTLGRWGERQSLPILIEWIEGSADDGDAFAAMRVGFSAVAQCMQREDIDWLLDLYFKQKDRWVMYPVICRIDTRLNSARERIMRELSSADANARLAAVLAMIWINYPDGDAIIAKMRADPHPDVKAIAKSHRPSR